MARGLLGLLWLTLLATKNYAADLCENEVDGFRIPHPDDCGSYIVCRGSMEDFVGSCPKGLHFNPTLKECDLKTRAGCSKLNFTQAARSYGFAGIMPCCDCSACSVCANDLTICKGKPDESLLPHPADCKKYYRCESGCAVEECCPYGLLYNARLESCDAACNVDCPGSIQPPKVCPNGLTYCQGMPNNVIIPYPGDCSKFIRCNDQCATVQQCEDGQLWNPTMQYCDAACNVDCPSQNIPSPNPPNPTGPSGHSCNSPGKCRGQPDGKMFKDDYSNGYIVCQCECEIQQSCPPGLIFKESLGVCDWPSQGSGSPVVCPPGLVYNPQIGVCDWPSQGGGSPVICPPGLVYNPQIGVCDWPSQGGGSPVVCPPGLVYNPQIGVCDWPSQGGGSPVVCPPGLVYNPQIGVCDWPSQNGGPSVPSGPSGHSCNSPGKCRGQPDGKMFKDDYSNGYIVCQCECEIQQSCPPGLIFKESLGVCDWPSQGSGSPVVCPPGLVYNPQIGVCDWPSQGGGSPVVCPPGLVYNPQIGVCDWPSQNGGPSAPTGPSGHSCNSPGKCRGQPDGKMFKDDYSNGYIVCQCECEIQQACPPGLIFKESLGVCDWPSQNGGSPVVCPPGLVYNPQIGCCDYPPPDEGCGNNTPLPAPPAPPTPPAPPAPSAPSAPTGPSGIACASGGRCANRIDGVMLPSTYSCNKYVVCQCGCEVEMSCPATLHYDAARNTCNYPDLANCRIY